MPLKLASKTQVSGHFFVRRRLAFALARRSVRMDFNPAQMQRTLLVVSAIVGATAVVGALALGWLRPTGTVGDSKIVADRKLGTLYVKVGDRLHPALNLVSAQLIAGEPASPVFVSSDDIAKQPMGPAVGIIGAPVERPAVQSPDVVRWAVCDTASGTVGGEPVITGIDGALTFGSVAAPVGAGDGVLLSYDHQAYLVNGGMRMPVDLGNAVVTSALGIAPTAQPVPMSRALFDALPAGGPLVVPVVPNAGAPGRPELGPGVVAGAVVASHDVSSNTDKFYVAIGDGVQEISPVVASMLRQTNSFGFAVPPKVSPDRLAHIPVRHLLDVDYYPKSPLRIVDTASQPVTCMTYRWGISERQAQLAVVSGRALPITSEQQSRLIPLVGGGTNGVQANQVLLSADASTFVNTTGDAVDSPARETLWLISSAGARYGIPFDKDNLKALGLDEGRVRPAPWAMLQVWPSGPELSAAAAATVHDSADGAVAPVATASPAAPR